MSYTGKLVVCKLIVHNVPKNILYVKKRNPVELGLGTFKHIKWFVLIDIGLVSQPNFIKL